MKKIMLIFAALALAAFSATSQVAPTEEETLVAQVGEIAPDFTIEMSNGEEIQISDLRGKVVLVTFWATWCPDCIKELAHLTEKILPQLEDKEFVFLPISTRERGDQKTKVEQFMTRNSYTFATGLDGGSIYEMFATNYVPRNFLIDAEGVIIATSTDIGFEEKIEKKLFEMFQPIK